MKHIFIINPMSGAQSKTDELTNTLKAYQERLDLDFYITKAEKDATRFIREYCDTHPDEQVRFYACGGDGTANEVACGVYGHPNASFTVYPCGSGNDFVKYYGGRERFLDLDRLLSAKETTIDAIMAGGNLAINVVNFGFDSDVCMTMIKCKRKPLIGGKNAYTTGVIHAVLCGMRTSCDIVADGECVQKGDMLLCTIANGNFVGGAFKCAPKSRNDDGFLDLCIVKPIPRYRFPALLGPYTKGEHLDDPRFQDKIVYRRCKKLEITAEGDFWVCVDGEMHNMNHWSCEVIPGALRFAVPEAPEQ